MLVLSVGAAQAQTPEHGPDGTVMHGPQPLGGALGGAATAGQAAALSADSVVIPNVNEGVEGPSNQAYPFNQGNMRYQQVYAADQFGDLSGTITGFAYRVDEFTGVAFAPRAIDVLISFSHTSAGPNDLNSVFDENIGPDETVVLDGEVVLSSDGSGAFDIVVDVDDVFVYNGVDNLLVEIRVFGTARTTQFDAAGTGLGSGGTPWTDRLWSVRGPDAETGSQGGDDGMVTQFTLEPVVVESSDPIVSFNVEAGMGDETIQGVDVRPVDAVNVVTAELVFSAFPDTILEDIDAFHVLPDGNVVFSTSTDVTQGFGGIAYIRNGDLVEWDGTTATLLFSELVGFGSPHNNIDAFSILPSGNWLLSTDLNATLGGLSFQNGDIVEYDPEADVATLYEGLDEATIFTGTPNSNADIDALHATADGTVIFSIRSDGIGRVGTGVSYGFADAPRTDLFEIDPVTLDGTLFLEGDGLFDGISRNLDAVALSTSGNAVTASCGLGFELALLLPPLWWLRERRRRSRR